MNTTNGAFHTAQRHVDVPQAPRFFGLRPQNDDLRHCEGEFSVGCFTSLRALAKQSICTLPNSGRVRMGDIPLQLLPKVGEGVYSY